MPSRIFKGLGIPNRLATVETWLATGGGASVSLLFRTSVKGSRPQHFRTLEIRAIIVNLKVLTKEFYLANFGLFAVDV